MPHALRHILQVVERGAPFGAVDQDEAVHHFVLVGSRPVVRADDHLHTPPAVAWVRAERSGVKHEQGEHCTCIETEEGPLELTQRGWMLHIVHINNKVFA